MDLQAIIAMLAANPAVAILITAATLAIADFAVGSAVAFRSGTWKPDIAAQWVGTHLLGRVMPIGVVALLGLVTPALFVVAGAALATYLAETVASLRRNLFVQDDETDQAEDPPTG